MDRKAATIHHLESVISHLKRESRKHEAREKDLERALKISEKHKDRYLDMLPDGSSYTCCDVCGEVWWERISLPKCECREFKICEDCGKEGGSGHSYAKCEDGK